MVPMSKQRPYSLITSSRCVPRQRPAASHVPPTLLSHTLRHRPSGTSAGTQVLRDFHRVPVTAAVLIYGGAETGKTRTASGAAGDPGLYSLCLDALCAAAAPDGGVGGEGLGGQGGGGGGGGDGGDGGEAGGLYMSFCEVVNEVSALGSGGRRSVGAAWARALGRRGSWAGAADREPAPAGAGSLQSETRPKTAEIHSGGTWAAGSLPGTR